MSERAELNKDVMQAVESQGYRVTVGDVAARAGLDIKIAQQGLLALASETQAHLEVSEAGEIAYEFPKNFRGVLRNKYWQLQLQEVLAKVWEVVFYLIRVSFGILLMLSIVVIFVAIFALSIAMSSQGGGDRDDRGGGGGGFMISPFNLFYLFDFGYGRRRQRYPNRYSGSSSRTPLGRGAAGSSDKLNFLEAIFSFLFGDGNPNADLEDRRWRTIGSVITNNGGVITAEQVAPYLDNLGEGWDKEYEDYMLPVLSRFNGQPEVSPNGEIVYYFPELQVSAIERGKASVSAYLKETKRKFTSATSDQVLMAIGLGSVNIIGALVLWNMFQSAVAQGIVLTGFVALVQSIFWILLAYGVSFLAIPLARYYWTQWRNLKIESRNESRQTRAMVLNQLGPAFQEKIAFAQQFAKQEVLRSDESVYSTETDLIEQEQNNDAQLEAEFQRRLNEI